MTGAELIRRTETWKLLARYWSAHGLNAERDGDAARLEIADREANESYRMGKMIDANAAKWLAS